jgi:chromate transport protein ChrA
VAWVRRVELALRPLVIAFMGAAALAIARDQLSHRWFATSVVCGLVATLYARGWLRPLPLMAVSGAAYWLLFVGFADRLP